MDKGRELSSQERAREASLESIRQSHAASDPVTLTGALGTVTLSDLAHVTQVPCARNALLYGVAAAVAIGGVQYFLKKSLRRGLNWGAASFGGVSLLAFESCRFARFQERKVTRYAVDRVEIKRKERREEGES